MLLQLLQINVKVDFLQILHHQLSEALANMYSVDLVFLRCKINDVGLAKTFFFCANFWIQKLLKSFIHLDVLYFHYYELNH